MKKIRGIVKVPAPADHMKKLRERLGDEVQK